MRFILLFFVMLTVSVSAETVFISVMPDIPLMPDAVEIEPISYDKPQGRIAQVSLYVDVQRSPWVLKRFYEDILPQLGWVKEEDDLYIRDHEILTMTMQDRVLWLTLKPK